MCTYGTLHYKITIFYKYCVPNGTRLRNAG
jgi:hypothetical protein